jgi:hypothetical protein
MLHSEGNNLHSRVVYVLLHTPFSEFVSLILVYVCASSSEKVLEKTFVTLHAYLFINVDLYTYLLGNVVINGFQL